jgi:hypothetical protein
MSLVSGAVLSTLQDTLNQGTPQADALVAPELLSVMAGGQGSGLRMNEAEISRIVGGRTQWESLKATVGKWQTDPNKGFALTPAQRQQVASLMSTVQQKLEAKQSAITQAQQDLIDADDPKSHQQTFANLRNKLTTIDSGSAKASTQSGGTTVTAPDGSVHTFPDQASAAKFKALAGIQ